MTACKIQIQLFCSPHITSNDLIQGCVFLEVSRDIQVKAIAIKLEGVASTFISISPYCSHSQRYKELYQKYDFLAPQTEPVPLKKGLYQYPFEFTVPEQLPPSFAYSVVNHIDYFLKVTVTRPGLSANYRSLMSLHHLPSVPYRNEDWSFDSKVVHVLVDPRQEAHPLKQLNLAAINHRLSQFIDADSRSVSHSSDEDSKAPTNSSQGSLVASRSYALSRVNLNPQFDTEISDSSSVSQPIEIERPRWNFFQKWRGKKAYRLQVEAWYMPEGLTVGEPLPLKMFIYVKDSMPFLELSMLRVGFEIKTEIRAEGQDYKENKEIQILRLNKPVGFSSSPIIDISHLVKDLRVPDDLTPSFRGHTIRRSYRLKIALRVNSSISRTIAVFRNDVKIHSNVESEALPLYQPSEFELPVYDSVVV